MFNSYLSDGSEAGQRPQAAAVGDDHGLRQQTGRYRRVHGRIQLVIHCKEEQVNSSSTSTACVWLTAFCCCDLTVTWQLCHGGHEGIGTHVTLELLGYWLLGGGLELLLE